MGDEELIATEQDIDNMCRVCLQEGLLKSVFADDEVPKLSFKINECASVQIEKGDGLPENICEYCISELNLAYYFRSQCRLSDIKLRRALQINPKVEESSLNTINNNNEETVPNNEEDITIQDQTLYKTPNEEEITIEEQTQCKIPDEENITIKEQPKTPAPADVQENPIEDELRLFLSEESGESCDAVSEKDPLEFNVCNKGPQSNNCSVVVPEIDETNLNTNLNSEADKAKNSNANATPITDNINGNKFGFLTENKLENLQPLFSLPTQEIITNMLPEAIKILSTEPFNMFSTFKSLKKMNSTKEENITKSKTKISCDYCGKNFMFKSRLMQHLATHSSERPFTCSRCPKAFSRKDSLMAHEITHTNVKPYKCDKCVAHFTRRHSLKKHYYVHTNEKSYSCELCLKSFGRRDNYIMHLKSHKGVKPFKCEECPKAFVRSDVLRRHKKTHENDPRNYICAICFKAYSRADSLRTHLKQHVKKLENINGK